MAYEVNGVGQAISLIAPTISKSEIRPARHNRGLVIQESLTYEETCLINAIWYRGREDELQQLYQKLGKRGIHSYCNYTF